MAARQGLFGGAIETTDARTTEPLDPDLARCFVASETPRADASVDTSTVDRAAPSTGRAGIVPVNGDPDTGALVFDGLPDDALTLPLAGASRSGVRRSLADAARSLTALHARRGVHGALRPAWIWRDPAGHTLVVVPARPVDAPKLLATALRVGAMTPAESAFAPPEVLAGGAATAASDVYALAAVTCFALTGELPVGQLDLGRVLATLPSGAAYTLARALQHAPEVRPSMAALSSALDVFADLPEHHATDASPVAAQGSELSAILMLVLAVGGLFVLSGTLWLVSIGWDQLGAASRVVLLFALTAGVWGAGEASLRARYPRSGLALVTLATQLLWADGAYILDHRHLDGAGPWTAVSGLVSAVTLLFALRLRASILGLAATINLCLAAVFLGQFLHTGTWYGPAVYTACVGAAFALLTVVAEGRAARAVGLPIALASTLSLLLSAFLGLSLLDSTDNSLFGTLWPYAALAALALPVVLRVRSPYAGLAGAMALLLTIVVPTAESVSQHLSLPYLAVAVLLGAATAATGILVPPFARDPGTELLLCLAGAVGLTAGPGLLAMQHLGTPDETRSMAIAVGIGTVTTILAFGLSERTRRKESYRVLEAAGLCLFFGVLTVGSLYRLGSYTYPAALFFGGAVALALGVLGRRATLVAFASVALLVNLWVQYFGKLKDLLPVSLLLVGFGIALLVGGVAFERRVKPLLPKLKDWA